MKLGRLVLAFLILAGSGTAAAGYWLLDRDPLLSLPRPRHALAAAQTAGHVADGRMIRHVTLHSAELGDIGIALSLPDPLPDRKLPILVVLGGLGSGENNIRYVTDAGDNAVVGYDWPMPVHFYGAGRSLAQIPALYGQVVGIPAQVTSAIDWLAAQPWADGRRVSLLSFSLGALVSPAVQDVAEHDGRPIGWTILAYGGAPFGDLIAASPHVKPAWIRPLLGSAVDLLLGPLQPTRHLAHLSGDFLVLEGRGDSLIPPQARARLRDAVPLPKTVVAFDGDHMGVGQDKMALLRQIVAVSKAWLVGQGAVDPL
ncbi:alpha/beta hydrolase family protein [Labrys monachus]|uniref:Alpha/beta hydrolase n=1 Tax=Labrys monachus TaxID=217067 RepID=A0ABU0F7A4_9HYPH|nr:hypothetical protein [Labrys monachus]MDQ0390316.1 hypothetical protein [Labrys monachus]